MSLDKAIHHKKEKRKPYTKSKAVDSTCRNHGSCAYCRANRQHKHKRQQPASDNEPITVNPIWQWDDLKKELVKL